MSAVNPRDSAVLNGVWVVSSEKVCINLFTEKYQKINGKVFYFKNVFTQLCRKANQIHYL